MNFHHCSSESLSVLRYRSNQVKLPKNMVRYIWR